MCTTQNKSVATTTDDHIAILKDRLDRLKRHIASGTASPADIAMRDRIGRDIREILEAS